ncbi:hypothetical protein DFH06DRAFT_1423563 [Mycena polygramma]|nr:hypothetical protein DFH06DRAFT_1423563 [Mycena polygramma]
MRMRQKERRTIRTDKRKYTHSEDLGAAESADSAGLIGIGGGIVGNDDDLWNSVNARLLSQFLARAACHIWAGRELPYEYLKMCTRIVPHVATPRDTISITLPRLPQPPSTTFDLAMFTRYFDPSAYDAQISTLDRIMACLFRIFPLLKLEEVLPIFTLYLVKRNYTRPVHFTVEDCDLRYLYKCFVVMLHLTDEVDDILRAITATLSCAMIHNVLFDWQEQDDQIYDFMTTKGLFGSPQFLCLSAIIKARKLSHIAGGWAPLVLQLINTDHMPPDVPLEDYDNWLEYPFVYCLDRIPRALREWRMLIQHPLLLSSGSPDTIPENPTAEYLVADIRARANRSLVISFTEFILSCNETTDQLYLLDTMRNLCRCLTFASFETIDSDTVMNYAKARLTLAQHLIDDPQNIELDSIAGCMFSEADLGGHCFPYNPIAPPIFKQAATVYLEFIKDNTTTNPSRSTQKIVEVLTAELQELEDLLVSLSEDSLKVDRGGLLSEHLVYHRMSRMKYGAKGQMSTPARVITISPRLGVECSLDFPFSVSLSWTTIVPVDLAAGLNVRRNLDCSSSPEFRFNCDGMGHGRRVDTGGLDGAILDFEEKALRGLPHNWRRWSPCPGYKAARTRREGSKRRWPQTLIVRAFAKMQRGLKYTTTSLGTYLGVDRDQIAMLSPIGKRCVGRVPFLLWAALRKETAESMKESQLCMAENSIPRPGKKIQVLSDACHSLATPLDTDRHIQSHTLVTLASDHDNRYRNRTVQLLILLSTPSQTVSGVSLSPNARTETAWALF